MKGLTLTEMSKILGLPPKTVERRIQRAGFKPITREAMYAPEVLEAIRDVRGKGRPPKQPADTEANNGNDSTVARE
jgi:hypothetical protein